MAPGEAQTSGAHAPLFIFPCNGNGLEALDCLGDAWRCVGFIDDTPDKQGRDAWGYPVLDRSALARSPDARVLAVPGSPTSYRVRHDIINGLGLDPADATQVQVSYLMPDLTGPCATRSLGCIAEVSVHYQFRAITPIVGGVIGPIDLTASTQLPIEFTKP